MIILLCGIIKYTFITLWVRVLCIITDTITAIVTVTLIYVMTHIGVPPQWDPPIQINIYMFTTMTYYTGITIIGWFRKRYMQVFIVPYCSEVLRGFDQKISISSPHSVLTL